MPLHTFKIDFPSGGVDRRHSFQEQPPFTTPDSLNVWPFEASTGKRRLGTRAGLGAFGGPGGTPFHWCQASYQLGTTSNPTTESGVALATSSNAFTHTGTGSTWKTELGGGAAVNTRSVAVYLQTLFYANGADATPFHYFPADSEGTIADVAFADLELLKPNDGGGPPVYTLDPLRCTLALAWGDRLLLSGDEQNSHVVYGCRIGNFLDWDSTALDPASSFETGSAFGLIHPPVTTLIPVSQLVVVIGGMDSMHVMRGNPSGGGSHSMLSSSVGPVRNNSWTRMVDGSILFMSRAGLYRTNGSSVESVSKDKIPRELMGIGENAADMASVSFDTRWNGAHVVGENDGTPFAFFLDLEKGGFWPMGFGSFVPEMAMSSSSHASQAVSNVLLLKSGACKEYDATATGSEDCHMCYGPIPMNGQFGEGVLQEFTATLGEFSDDVHWCLYFGSSPQEAWSKVQKDLDDDGSKDHSNADYVGEDWEVKGGRTHQYVQRPMLRGNCFYLKVWGDSVGGTENDHIVIEELIGKVSVSPERRIR